MISDIKDSGKRESFNTGSVRDTREGKGRFDLLPPTVMRLLAVHYEKGALKYGDRNWEKGQPLSRTLDSAMRHINEYREGLRDEPHLVAATWNLMAALHTLIMIERGILPAKLNDIPSYQTKEIPASGGQDQSTGPSPSSKGQDNQRQGSGTAPTKLGDAGSNPAGQGSLS